MQPDEGLADPRRVVRGLVPREGLPQFGEPLEDGPSKDEHEADQGDPDAAGGEPSHFLGAVLGLLRESEPEVTAIGYLLGRL
jgi:hypothetical protein